MSPLSLFTRSIHENFFCPTGYLDPLHQWERRDYWWPHSHKDWPRLPLHRLQRWLRWQGFSSYQGKTGLVCMDGESVTHTLSLSGSLGQAGRAQSCRLWCWSGVPRWCSTDCSARYIFHLLRSPSFILAPITWYFMMSPSPSLLSWGFVRALHVSGPPGGTKGGPQ